MLEKTAVATLLATLMGVGYANVADNIEPIIDETVASVGMMQERELATALEIYYVKFGYYPDAYNSELIKVLYEEECIKSDTVAYDIEYSSPSGQSYTLSIE